MPSELIQAQQLAVSQANSLRSLRNQISELQASLELAQNEYTDMRDTYFQFVKDVQREVNDKLKVCPFCESVTPIHRMTCYLFKYPSTLKPRP